MDQLSAWWNALLEWLAGPLARIGDYLPTLAAVLAVMLGGWIVAALLRALLMRSGRALDSLLARIGRPLAGGRAQLSQRLVTVISNLVFWIVILIAAAIAARTAGLDAFSGWLDRVVDYLPTLLAGVLITLAGYLLSALVRDIVSTAFVSVGSRANQLAGVAAQVAVFVTALVIGLDQIGIDVTFLIILAAVLVGGAVLSIALAFGLGARDFVANLIAARQLDGVIELGALARIADIEGRVLEVSATAIIMVNEQGRVVVPASYFQREASMILSGEMDE